MASFLEMINPTRRVCQECLLKVSAARYAQSSSGDDPLERQCPKE